MPEIERRGQKQYTNGKGMPPQPGDEVVGGWSHAELERMDRRFTERMQRAIERGLEQPPDGDAPERAA